jgi:hypothetical protein
MGIFLPGSVQAILLGLLAVVFVLSRLARRFPHVAWLRVFRLPVIRMSEEQRARRRRAGNRMAGRGMVLVGIVLPPLYIASRIIFFSEPLAAPAIIVTACSVFCISLGVWIFVRNG